MRSEHPCLLYFNSYSKFVLVGSAKSLNYTAKANLFILRFIEQCHLRPIIILNVLQETKYKNLSQIKKRDLLSTPKNWENKIKPTVPGVYRDNKHTSRSCKDMNENVKFRSRFQVIKQPPGSRTSIESNLNYFLQRYSQSVSQLIVSPSHIAPVAVIVSSTVRKQIYAAWYDSDFVCFLLLLLLFLSFPLNARWHCLDQSDLQFTTGIIQLKEQMSTSLAQLK